MHDEITRVLNQLTYAVLSSPGEHTDPINTLLNQLKSALGEVEQHTNDPVQQVVLTYDLLLVYTSKIEQIYQSRHYVVEQLMTLLEKSYQDPRMPESVKNAHPYRHALVMHRHLTLSQLIDLTRLAYARLASMFTDFPDVGIIKGIKMTVGNSRAGPSNLKILAALHPLIAELTLPFGQLKDERDGFINAMATRMLSYSAMNGTVAGHTMGASPGAPPNIDLDFGNILNLVNIVSNQAIMRAMGDTPDSLDVQVIQAKTRALQQFRKIMATTGEAWLKDALTDRPRMKNNLTAMFTHLAGLQGIYTWGDDLDIALAGFANEIQAFSRQMLVILKALPKTTVGYVLLSRKDWQLADILGGPAFTISALVELSQTMIQDMLPTIIEWLRRILPHSKYQQTWNECKEPIEALVQNAIALAKIFEKEGLYAKLTQDALAPCREHLLKIDVLRAQQLISIYRHHFEPLLEIFLGSDENLVRTWERFERPKKDEIILNVAKALFSLRHYIDSLLPILSDKVLSQIKEALKDNPDASLEFERFVNNLNDLKLALMTEIQPLIIQGIQIFASTGHAVTLGNAVEATSGSSAGRVITDATLWSYKLELGYTPTQNDVSNLPSDWQGKNLKTIFKLEMKAVLALVDRFTQENPELHSAMRHEKKHRV